MKKRLVSGLLTAVFLFGLLPQTALPARAANTPLTLTSQTLSSGEYDLDAGSASGISIIITGDVTIHVNGSTSIDNTASGGAPIDVRNGATLTIDVASTGVLTVRGQDGTDGGLDAYGNGGYAGIHVAPLATLKLKGSGKVNATGGDAGDGGDGECKYYTNHNSPGSYAGGGGGGGGAGIGGNGSVGSKSIAPPSDQDKTWRETGFDVLDPSDPGDVQDSGAVYLYDTLTITARGGKGGDGGDGGGSPIADPNRALEGAGGGGGGYPGAGIGGGGGGGGCGYGEKNHYHIEIGGGGFSGGGGGTSGNEGSAFYGGLGGSNGQPGSPCTNVPGAVNPTTPKPGGGGYLGAAASTRDGTSNAMTGGVRYGGGGAENLLPIWEGAGLVSSPTAGSGGDGGSGTVYYRTTVTLDVHNGGAKDGTAVTSRTHGAHEGMGGGYGFNEGASTVSEFYYIDFDPNGGTAATANSLDRQGVAPTQLVTQPSPNPTRTGYVFDCWNTKADGSGTDWNFSTMHPTQDIKLFAQWKPQVTYNGNTPAGATGTVSGIPATATLNMGDRVSKPTPDPTLTGYTFGGWYKETGCTNAWNFGTETVTGPTTLYAKWKPNVTYDGNAPAGAGTVTNLPAVTGVDSGVPFSKPADPSLTGYTFGGWFTDKNCTSSNQWNFTYDSITAPTTLYAKWTANGLTVTYHLQGVACSGFTDPKVENTSYNALLTAPQNPAATNAGYTFDGWYTNPQCTVSARMNFNNYHVTSSLDLYAKWLLTVDYNAQGVVQDPTSDTPVLNGTLDQPTLSTRTGFTFKGWFTDDSYATQWVFGPSGSKVTAPMTLYAKWLVTVKYDNKGIGPTLSPDPNAVVGKTLTTPTPSATGYTFGGWYTDSNCTAGDEWTAASTVTGPMTLYAKWDKNKHTVTYKEGGATGAAPTDPNSPHAYQDTVTVMDQGALVWPGKNFDGWRDGHGTAYAANSTFPMPDEDVVLTAQWSDGTYHVTYDKNSTDPALTGTVPTDGNSYHYGDPAVILGNTGNLERPGYTFLGWNTDSTAATALAGSCTIQGDTTFFAIWQEDKYHVTYDGNGATGSPLTDPAEPTGHRYDAQVTVLGKGTLAKAGAAFDGWNTQADGSGLSYDPGDTFHIRSDVKLYAQWLSDQYHITYNGNFNDRGTPPLDAGAYKLGDSANILGNSGALERDGYTFDNCWNTASDGSGVDYAPGDTISMTGSLLLYAKWKPIDYHVTYNANAPGATGDVPVDSSAYRYNGSVTVLGNVGTTPLELAGKTFAGWATVASPTASDPIYSAGSSFTIQRDTTLYAQWEDAVYHVTYDGNGADGGTLPLDSNGYGHHTQAVVLANTLTRSGYVFKHWNTEPDDSGTPYDGTGVDTIPSMEGDVKLYAIWEKESLKVTYYAPGATGSVPVDNKSYAPMAQVTVLGRNDLEKPGYSFAGWNTKADGSGSTYVEDAVFTITASTELYAKWSNLYYIYISANTDPVIFKASHYEYTATVPYETTFVDLAVAYSQGTVSYHQVSDDPTAASPLASEEYVKADLRVGENKIYVYGTDALGHSLKYTYTIIRKQQTSTGGGGGSWGGGGGTTYYYPVVYLPGEGGTLPGDVATEQVAQGGKPKKAPTVTAKKGYLFKGWSLDGKTVVDPKTVTVNKLTTFTALYDFDEDSAPEHVWYMQGYEDGTFRPTGSLARCEIVAMLSRLDPTYREGAHSTTFADVEPGAWYYSYVAHAQAAGLVQGYPDGLFHPNEKITRAEFVTVMCNYLGLKNEGTATFPDTAGNWAEGYIAQLTAMGVVNGYPNGTFRPGGEISRSEAVKIINRVFGREPSHEQVGDHVLPYPDVPEQYWARDDITEASFTHKENEFH